MEQDNIDLNEKLTEALKIGLKSRKKAYYLKGTNSKEQSLVSHASSFSQSYVSDLKDKISILENEKLELEEKIQYFVTKEIKVYNNGCYDDSVD